MRRRLCVAVVLVVLLALGLSGCSSGPSSTEAETNVGGISMKKGATVVPSMTQEVGGDEEGALAVDVVDVNSLDSYRQMVSWSMTEGGVTEEWSATTEFVREPAAQRSVWQGVDKEGVASGWETIQIGTVTYMRGLGEGEEWMSMTSQDAQPPTQQVTMLSLQEAESILSSGHCKREGQDDVEGQPATHYVCSKEILGENASFQMEEGELTDGGLELWVSDEHNVQVRSIMWWEAENEEGAQQAWRMEQKIWDINRPITIEAPAGVAAPGLPDDVPLIPEATITSALSGIVSFEVDMALDAVVAFFKEEMPDNGWSLESENKSTLTYSKEGRQAMIVLSEEEAMLTGMIMITEE